MKLALPRLAKTDVLEYHGERLRLEREWEDNTLLMTRLSSDRQFLVDGEAPRKRRGRKRSVRLRVKVKYNPADLSQIHVYDPKLQGYVTLECKEEFFVI